MRAYPVVASIPRLPTVPLRAALSHKRWRHALLAGSSVTVLSVFGPQTADAGGTPFGSHDYFNQLSQRQGTGSAALAGTGPSLPLSAIAQQIAQRSAQDLAAAAQAIAAQQAAQNAAAAVAQAMPTTIPNGLAAGGLVVAQGVASDPTLWQNALLPVSSTVDGATTITIDQTAPKAILTWNSFNVGKGTTVYFDQAAGTDSSGNNAWVALNRINDPSGVPSQILGTIKAEGAVYLIDRNGIEFGGSSQIDLHTLIASSLDIGELGQTRAQRDQQFLQEGLNIETSGGASLLSGLNNSNVAFSTRGNPLADPPEGAVIVDAGAVIRTSVQGSDNPGSVMLLAPSVSNAGSIAAPGGQVILAAGRAFAFLENTTVDPSAGEYYLGLLVESAPSSVLVGSPYFAAGLPAYQAGASAINSGLIETNRGNITLSGTTVENDGVLAATTSITRNGSIVLDGVTSAVLGTKAVATILPAENGETIPEGQITQATFPQPYVQIQAAEIGQQTGNGDAIAGVGQVTIGAAAAIVAPGAAIGVFGGQSVYVSQNSLIDAAGLTSAVLPMSANYVTFSPRGPELADSPLQRAGALYGTSITVDIRDSGTTTDGRSWVGTPIADASGYVAAISQSVDQLLAEGGTVSISTALGNDRQAIDNIVLRSGATIDVSGGFVTYQGGTVSTTRLVGADGALYQMADADPNLSYVGIAGSFTVSHPHWAVTTTYGSPIVAGAQTVYEPGYIEGHDAGGINLRADAIVDDATLIGQAAAGPHQNASATIGTATAAYANDTRHLQASNYQLPSAGYLLIDPTNIAQANPTIASLEDGTAVNQSYVLLQSAPAALPAALGPGTIIAAPAGALASGPFGGLNPADIADTLVLSTDLLNAGGFAEISARGRTRQLAGTSLTVADGGSLSFTGEYIDIQGTLTARAGTIALVTDGSGDPTAPGNSPSITIDQTALLDTRGRWTNDTGQGAATIRGAAFIDGGTIRLISDARSSTITSNGPIIDTTGGIVVATGATLDVSGGGYVKPDGTLLTGSDGTTPAGAGGSITLETYAGGFSTTGESSALFPTSDVLSATVSIDLQNSVRAFGFSGGGKLTIQVGPSVEITDSIARMTTQADGTLLLPAAMFGSGNPFGAFDIESDGGSVTVEAGTHLHLEQANFQPAAATLSLPTGADIYATAADRTPVDPIGTTPKFFRVPVNLTLGNGNGDIGFYPDAPIDAGRVTVAAGASIESAPNGAGGATIALNSIYQTDIEGSIGAPGGRISLASTGNLATGLAELAGKTIADGVVYLAADSFVDVSGRAVYNTDNVLYRSGTILGGGEVSLTANGAALANASFGYVAEAAQSRIDIDGASGALQFLVPTASGTLVVSQSVATDAGLLLLSATAGILDGTVDATGGGKGAADGILTVTSATAPDILITARGRSLGPGFQPETVPGDLTRAADGHHEIVLSSDLIDASRFDDVNFGQIDPTSATGSSGVNTVLLQGDVSLIVDRALRFYAPLEVRPGDGDRSPSVTLSAPYLLLATTATNLSAGRENSFGSLTATADEIVLERGWIDAASVSLASTGDVQVAPVLNSTDQNYASGGLVATGNLSISAADLYPTGGAEGIIQALAPTATAIARGAPANPSLTILQSGSDAAPLSAGGTLYLLAADIVQDGTVRAPGGSIIIGNSAAPGFFTFLGTDASAPTIVAADSVTFAPSSITSVSLGGASLPYGGTVDGREWFYGDDPTRSNAPLTALPAKTISVSAGTIDVAQGATIDLSGSGDLYATEFVPGNGGSRNVLSTENSYTATAFNPHNVGNDAFDNNVSQIYAILPGANPAASPSDIDFSTATGLGTQSVAPGLSVTLSAGGGLPAGTYTLLPAAYATLPGAYRVVVTGTDGFVPSENSVLPDGTLSLSGRFATPDSGEQSSIPQQFLVQSSTVWRLYSEIDQTSGNSFFARTSATPTARVPEDAGHLILAAGSALNLAGTLDNAAPAGALGSLVDIAAGDTEILDPGQTARPGYVGLEADQLSALDAGSLLIGGTRAETPTGDVILATSRSVLVANEAAHPLTGPEILLVTTGDSSGTDPNAATGLSIAAGAVIEATGTAPQTASLLTIGALPGTGSAASAGSRGDGAFIGLTTGADLQLSRVNLPGGTGASVAGPAVGNVSIAAGATLNGGNDLLIDTAGTGTLDPDAHLLGANVSLSAGEIGLGAAPSGNAGLVLSAPELASLAGLSQLQLHSRDAISFYGPVALSQSAAGSILVLDAGTLTGTGGSVSLSASTVSIENLSGAAGMTSFGTSTLSINAGTIAIGSGAVAVAGFDRVVLNAATEIEGAGSGGSFNAGAAPIAITAPQLVAGTGTWTTITTGSTLTIQSGGGTPSGAGTALGGAFTLQGASVTLDSAVYAPSGRIAIEASSGDLDLGSNAVLSVGGTAERFFDLTKYSPAGTIALTADQGSISAAAGSLISVAGAVGGGIAGTLQVSAPLGNVALAGTLDGASADGTGGSFSLTIGQSLDLDALAATLDRGGFHNDISIEAAAGNLTLNNSLTAAATTLSADAGSISIGSSAVIDASGAKGGTIDLFGQTGVDVEGRLLAEGSDPTRAGGTVEIGTGGVFDGTYNAQFGYENVSSAGPVTIGPNAVINVSGGTIAGLTGGVVLIRVPLLENGTIALSAANGAQIIGAHDVIVDAYATWSTSDATTGGQHFDGIVDPAGWYNSTGQLVGGSDQNGNVIAPGSTLAPGSYFTPTAPNLDHVYFYQQTLMGFVQGFQPVATGPIAALGAVELQPGIDLVNDEASINGGNIVVATAWNLGAGGYDASGHLSLFYRTASGQPGDLTLRAVNDVKIDASLTDGFFQPVNQLDPRYLTLVAGAYLDTAPGGNSTEGGAVSPLAAPSAPYDTSDATYNGLVNQYYTAYQQGYLTAYVAYRTLALSLAYPLQPVPSGTALPTAPAAPLLGTPASYGATTVSYAAYVSYYGQVYAKEYAAYVAGLAAACTDCAAVSAPAAITAPPAFGADLAQQTGSFSLAGSLSGQYGANGVSPNPTAADPNPILSSSLFPLATNPSGRIIGLDGTHYSAYPSWSFAVVGGASPGKVDPLAVAPLASFASGGGDVLLEDHTTFASALSTVTGLVPTVIRTGTGSIDIAAGDNVAMTDDLAPGAIYTAGRQSAPLPDAGYVSVDDGSALNGPNSLAATTGATNGTGTLGDGLGSTEIGNTAGFNTPDFGDSVVFTSPTLFAITQPGYAEAGGHVSITAQNNITGIQDIAATKPYTSDAGGFLTPFWATWLFTRSNAVPATSGNTEINFDAETGVYDPNGSHQVGSVHTDLNDGQTTWWVNYGSFDQGIATLGGGDVTITAGANITQLAASAVATGRVSGGLSAASLPVLHLTGGGDLTVTAGGNIVAGDYYVALGKGSITAGGSITADPSWSYSYTDTKSATTAMVTVNPATIIGVGDAQISVTARGSVDLGDVVNPTEIASPVQLQVSDDYIVDHGGASSLATRGSNGVWVLQQNQFNTMGPESALSVASISGEVTLEALPSAATGDGRNPLYRTLQTLLPATLDVEAFRGDILVLGSFDQVNSATGTLDLLAQQSIRLEGADNLVGTGGSASIIGASADESTIATYQTNFAATISTYYPIPGLVDAAFDPQNPDAGLNAAGAAYVQLREAGGAMAHLYAVQGDITNGPASGSAVADTTLPMPVLADLPIAIRAGRDIVNLQLYAENDLATDVTTVSAGRDLTYDLPARDLALTDGPNGLNLIELAGPGALVVSAGRNLGPFPNDFDAGPSGIETTGNTAWITGYVDPLLSAKGASIYAFAGVASGVDDQAVIDTYVNPAGAALVTHNYLPELVTYLQATLGLTDLSESDAWARFKDLSTDAQDIFADQVFFAELQATQASGATPSYQRGYRAVTTLFPARFGYTADNVSGGTNGATSLVQTGNIDLRSATIQTQHGGSIDLFTPGGGILLGSTSARTIYDEPGLTGVLTLQGGTIDLYADQSITVNQSRILTEEGGDVLVWSSNGNILAGIGAKTSADFPPYTVLYDSDGEQALDPAGLVTGAGIGALLTIPGQDPSLSNAFLIAPRGTVDAGDAGIRVAGNLFVAALHVTNAGNISVGGTAVGVPQPPSVNIGALTSAAAAAAVGERSADALQSFGSAGTAQQSPSIITIDVLGFGGE